MWGLFKTDNHVSSFKVYVACQSMLIVLVGAVPQYHINQEEIPASRDELAKHIQFTDNFTSIVTEASAFCCVTA